MSEDIDLFVPVELVAPPPPNREHTELEGEQPVVELPGGEDSAALVM